MSTEPSLDLGLRPEDLTDDERAARDARLRDDPEAAAEHAFGMHLHDRLRSLPEPEVQTPPEHVWRSRGAGGSWWALGPLVAMAAALLLWIGQPQDLGGRERGTGASAGGLILEAVARHADGSLRPLGNGATVHGDEQVLFRITTTEPGDLSLLEDGTVIHPVGRSWRVSAGQHSPGGTGVLGYRTDAGPGVHRYTVRRCPEDSPRSADCVADTLTLGWSADP